MNRAPNRGMTLLEIAMAVSIVAIMGTLTWGSLARSFDIYEAVTDVDARYHNVRVAMDRMSRELSSAFLTSDRRHRNTRRGRRWVTVFQAENDGDFTKVHFVSFSHQIMLKDAKESDQNEISYFGDRDPDHPEQQNLMRRESSVIDTKFDEGGRVDILAENIKSFKLRFWNPKSEEWIDEWDTQKSDFARRLPSVIEITLTLLDEDEKEIPFTTKVRVTLDHELGTL